MLWRTFQGPAVLGEAEKGRAVGKVGVLLSGSPFMEAEGADGQTVGLPWGGGHGRRKLFP